MSALEAKLNLKDAELNNLITRDTPDMKVAYRKIDEVTGLKREMMIKKYDHIAEMRGFLSSEQRSAFDTGLLGMEHKGQH